MTRQTTPDTADAVAAALLRHAAVVPLWIVWLITRLPLDTAPGPVSLITMTALLFLYVA